MNFIESIEASGLFICERNLVTMNIYRLINTDFMIQISKRDYFKPQWFHKWNDEIPVSFDDILQSVPLSIQEKLLFHLDVFR